MGLKCFSSFWNNLNNSETLDPLEKTLAFPSMAGTGVERGQLSGYVFLVGLGQSLGTRKKHIYPKSCNDSPPFAPCGSFQLYAQKLAKETVTLVKPVTLRGSILDIYNPKHTFTHLIWHPLAFVGVPTLWSTSPAKPQTRWRKPQLFRLPPCTSVERGQLSGIFYLVVLGQPIATWKTHLQHRL